jgi:microcin C transport system substrate-binding protein
VEAVDHGTLIMEILDSTDPEGASGFWFNLRRPQFEDPRVREALTYLYDFETAQRQIHYGFFERAESYFPNTELAATGLPEGEELEILRGVEADMPAHIRERIFTEVPALPTTDGSGRIRENLRTALRLFAEAGWEVQDGVLTNVETGEPMAFELVYGSPTIEPTMLGLVRNFERAGIRAVPRFVDGANWQNRIFEYDYDLFFGYSTPFYPPGASLREAYGSAVADVPGNYNLSGVQDPALDQLVELVIAADSWDEMVVRTRALDRYLRFSWLKIPFYYDDTIRIAYWDILERPEQRPRFGLAILSTWWFDGTNEDALRENR